MLVEKMRSLYENSLKYRTKWNLKLRARSFVIFRIKNIFRNTIKITRVVNLSLEFWTVGCRKLITWWPKEVVTWHKKVVMWFVWNGLTVMAFNKEGWFYKRGKGPSEELKGQIVNKILETGGDRILGYFPAKWTKLGDKFGVSDYGELHSIFSFAATSTWRNFFGSRDIIFQITWPE